MSHNVARGFKEFRINEPKQRLIQAPNFDWMSRKEEIDMDEREKEVLTAAVLIYGPEAQQKMVLEEMSELQKEICKLWRGKDTTLSIAEEVADVEIMLDQLKLMLGISGKVQEFRRVKMLRLEQRLWGEKDEPAT